MVTGSGLCRIPSNLEKVCVAANAAHIPLSIICCGDSISAALQDVCVHAASKYGCQFAHVDSGVGSVLIKNFVHCSSRCQGKDVCCLDVYDNLHEG